MPDANPNEVKEQMPVDLGGLCCYAPSKNRVQHFGYATPIYDSTTHFSTSVADM